MRVQHDSVANTWLYWPTHADILDEEAPRPSIWDSLALMEDVTVGCKHQSASAATCRCLVLLNHCLLILCFFYHVSIFPSESLNCSQCFSDTSEFSILCDFSSHASSSIETRFPLTQSQGPNAAWGHRKLSPWGEGDSWCLPQPGRSVSISLPLAVSVEGNYSFSHSAPVPVL